MTVAAIIQARMGSTRLPGKVAMPLAGRPMLEHVVHRVAAAHLVDEVCVATTERERDDPLVPLAEGCGATVFRGDEEDVLSRYVGAARALGAGLVVRVTSDCPLIDPEVIDAMLARRARLVRETGEIHYYSNTLTRTWPRGLDTEIVPRAVLEEIAAEATDRRAREHVTWFLHTNPDRFRLVNHAAPGGRDDSALRWTVDTPEDFELVARIYDELGGGGSLFPTRAVLDLLERRPELRSINAGVEQKKP